LDFSHHHPQLPLRISSSGLAPPPIPRIPLSRHLSPFSYNAYPSARSSRDAQVVQSLNPSWSLAEALFLCNPSFFFFSPPFVLASSGVSHRFFPSFAALFQSKGKPFSMLAVGENRNGATRLHWTTTPSLLFPPAKR